MSSQSPEHSRSTAGVLPPIALAVIVVVASVSMVNIAIPYIGADLGADQSQLQWIVDAYALALAALLLPFGALGDRYGRKTLMVIGLVVLAAALGWAAFASSTGVLIAARAVAGIGAAMVFPGTLSTITNVFPEEQRGRAVGIWAACASIGGILGVVGAGAMIQSFWWGSVFLIVAVAAVAALAGILLRVPNTSDPSHSHLDPAGAVLSVLGVGGLVLGITEGPVKGWTHPLTAAGLLVGIVGLVAFVLWERHTPKPLLDVRLFAHRGFSTGSLSVFLQFFGAFGFFFVGTQLVSYVFGYGPLRSGVALLPIAILLIPLSSQASRLAARFGRGRVGGLGLALSGAGAIVMSTMEPGSGYLHFALGLIVFGAGMGLAATPATEAIIESLPAAKQGVASATNDVARELGGALGIAVIGSTFTSAYHSAVEQSSVLATLPAGAIDVVRSSPAAGLQVAQQAGPAGEAIVAAVRDTFTQGFGVAMIVTASVFVLGALVVAVRSPRLRTEDVLDAEPGDGPGDVVARDEQEVERRYPRRVPARG